eukprot:g10277.t1
MAADYGLGACAAHDSNNTLYDCTMNAHPYCTAPWCYVDTSLCQKNNALCVAAGGDISPYCRTRSNTVSPQFNITVAYSYETCGSINHYDIEQLAVDVSGHSLKAAIDFTTPWVVERTGPSFPSGYGGASYDFFIAALNLIEPNVPTVNIVPGWATAGSRALYSSSYTACVHDVAVGNFDVCIADLWVTPERTQLATFTPAIRQDFFYLVVPRKIVEATFMTRLTKPFLPFSIGAWLGIAAFLFGLALVLWLLHIKEHGYERSESFGEFLRLQWHIWHDFLLGGGNIEFSPPDQTDDAYSDPALEVREVPGPRSFAFFILVIIASYTASLTTELVVQAEAQGTLADLTEAMQQDRQPCKPSNYQAHPALRGARIAGNQHREAPKDAEDPPVKICVPSVLKEVFETVYSYDHYVGIPYDSGPYEIYNDICGALIQSQDFINSMKAGNVAKADEAKGRPNWNVGLGGQKRSDCDLMEVGKVLWNVPLAFPIRVLMQHPLSWAFVKAWASGMFQDLTDRVNADLKPVSQCEAVSTRDESSGLELGDISGAIFIGLFIAVVGGCCYLGELIYQKAAACSPWGERRDCTFDEHTVNTQVS